MNFESYSPRASLRRMLVAGTAAAALAAAPGVALAAEPAEGASGAAEVAIASGSGTAAAEGAQQQVSGAVDQSDADEAAEPATAEDARFVGVSATSGADAAAEAASEPDAAAEPASGPVEDGTYTIGTYDDHGKVLDCADGGTSDRTNVQVYQANRTDGQQWDLSYDAATGYYAIYEHGTDKCLDIVGGSAERGTNVWLFSDNGTLGQRWSLTDGRADGSWVIASALDPRLVLDLAWGRTDNGTNVQVYERNGTDGQRFYLLRKDPPIPASERGEVEGGDGLYVIEASGAAGQLLDVADGSKSNSANVQAYASNGTLGQKFYFERDAEGYYVVTNAGSGKVLDVADGGLVLGSNVQQYSRNGTDGQRWAVSRDAATGCYVLKNKGSGLVLDLAWGSAANGSNLQTYSYNGTAGQLFRLTRVGYVGDGVYQITSLADPGQVVDVRDVSSSPSASIQAHSANDSLAQRFELSFLDDGTFRIRTAASGGWLTWSSEGGRVAQRGDHSTAATSRNTWRFVWRGGYYVVEAASESGVALRLDGTANGSALRVARGSGDALQHFSFDRRDLVVEGLYEVASRVGLNLDVAGGSTSPGANVQVHPSNGDVAQKFYFTNSNGYYVVTNAASGLALDVAWGSPENGANVQMYTRNGANAQLWDVRIADGGYLKLVNLASGKALDVADGLAVDGTNVQSYEINDAPAQSWKLKRTHVVGWNNIDGSWYYFSEDGSKSAFCCRIPCSEPVQRQVDAVGQPLHVLC